MDKGRHIFLEKVVNRLVKDTIITYDKYEGDDVVITPFPSVDGYFTKFWFTRKSIGSRIPSFKSYIEYTYGVTDTEEINVIYSNYESIISDKLFNGMITENIYHDMFGERVSNYMEKVLKYLVDDTYIEEMSGLRKVMIRVPFSGLQYSRIRHFNVGFFIDYCMGTYGLTRKESEYLWGDYLNEINGILRSEYGVRDPEYR